MPILHLSNMTDENLCLAACLTRHCASSFRSQSYIRNLDTLSSHGEQPDFYCFPKECTITNEM